MRCELDIRAACAIGLNVETLLAVVTCQLHDHTRAAGADGQLVRAAIETHRFAAAIGKARQVDGAAHLQRGADRISAG